MATPRNEPLRLGELLRFWRVRMDFSVRELADEIGVHKDTINKLELGRSISARSLALVLRWLLEDIPDNHKKEKC